jgi:toxin FitB
LILLDTNVLSELVKPRPNAQVVAWMRRSAGALAVPTIAVAEMAFWNR